MEENTGLITPNSVQAPNNSKRIILFSVVGLAAVLVLIAVLVPILVVFGGTSHRRQNIVMVVGDGYGPAAVTLGRLCSSGNLTMDKYLTGTIRTRSAFNLITDSAAGATSYSCGVKTYNEAIAVDSNQKPCKTLLEQFKELGYATGVVTTTRITHATPASFTAHVVDRNMESEIAKQQVLTTKPDLMFGGGRGFFDNRNDGLNLLNDAQNVGYKLLLDYPSFSAYSSWKLPLLGLFAEDHLDYEIDRIPTQQPSLTEMWTQAINILSGVPNSPGFFLQVESGRIDMAAHNNDPATVCKEVQQFDTAFSSALTLLSSLSDADSLLVMTADHETGGLSLGRGNYSDPLSYPLYNWFPAFLSGAKKNCSSEFLQNLFLVNSTTEFIQDALVKCYNITDLNFQEISAIQTAVQTKDFLFINRAIAAPVSARSFVQWATWGHSGVDVNLYGWSSNPAWDMELKSWGNRENTELNALVKRLWNIPDAVTMGAGAKRKVGDGERVADKYHH